MAESRRVAGSWMWLVVAGLVGTALFVPIRIAYKQNQKPAAAPGEVVISNFVFAPERLVVPAGTTVTFRNVDGAAHTATADDQSFDSGRLAQGQAFELMVSKSVTYYCDIHQYMTGSIDVEG